MNTEIKKAIHEIIEYATQTLKRYDNNDDHWIVLVSLLRFEAIKFVKIYEEGEEEE